MSSIIEKQKQQLRLFVKRMPMYVGTANRESITSFMVGFEYGAACNGLWTEQISSFLEEKHGIEKRAMGWSHQLDVYAKRTEKSWEETFRFVLMQITSS